MQDQNELPPTLLISPVKTPITVPSIFPHRTSLGSYYSSNALEKWSKKTNEARARNYCVNYLEAKLHAVVRSARLAVFTAGAELLNM